MSWHRVRTDFRFAIITLFIAVGVLGITPFAIYRFARGQVFAGAVDLAMVLIMTVGGVVVWRGGDIQRASWVTVAVYNIGCLVVASQVGLTSVFWMYPILAANFMLVGRRLATAVSSTSLLVMTVIPGIFADPTQEIIFLVSAVLVCLFGLIFAHRTESQREQLEEIASHDPLTGAYNRRAMEREVAIAIEAYRRHRTACGLAIVDLDHFKRINDTHGHEEGDRVLVDFADLVARGLRKGDRLFRYGGEEFVLLLPGAEGASLELVCDNLRERIATERTSRGAAITVSIGAAELQPDEDAGSWVSRADKALYEAKAQGRNRVVVHPGGQMGDAPAA